MYLPIYRFSFKIGKKQPSRWCWTEGKVVAGWSRRARRLSSQVTDQSLKKMVVEAMLVMVAILYFKTKKSWRTTDTAENHCLLWHNTCCNRWWRAKLATNVVDGKMNNPYMYQTILRWLHNEEVRLGRLLSMITIWLDKIILNSNCLAWRLVPSAAGWIFRDHRE